MSELIKKNLTENDIVYLIEYDIPTNRRKKFYRELKKMKEKENANFDRSTLSVLCTKDPEVAKKIYHLASYFGKAKVYIAAEVG